MTYEIKRKTSVKKNKKEDKQLKFERRKVSRKIQEEEETLIAAKCKVNNNGSIPLNQSNIEKKWQSPAINNRNHEEYVEVNSDHDYSRNEMNESSNDHSPI